MNPEIDQIKLRIQDLEEQRMARWRSIKDFSNTSYEDAERVGRVISSINKQITDLKRKIAKLTPFTD